MNLPAPLPARSTHRDVAFFFDLDGTLSDIAARPEDARVPRPIIALLDRLTSAMGGAVAILSGRPLEQVDALIAPLLLPAAGLHGGELRFPDGKRLMFQPTPYIRSVVKGGLAGIELPAGAWIEDKRGVAFALHHRDAPEAGAALMQSAQRIVAQTHGGYTVLAGRCVVELCPAGRSKGTALRRLMGTAPFLGRVPLVMGDDVTDEDAFEEAALWGGSSIVVGARTPTCAEHRIDGPEAAREWLRHATDALERHALHDRLAGAA